MDSYFDTKFDFAHVQALVDAFCAMIPKTDSTYATHAVISDYNLWDEDIQSALKNLHNKERCGELTPAEIEASRAFLQFLLTIPEQQRIMPD